MSLEAIRFSSVQDAFDYCREMDRPVKANIPAIPGASPDCYVRKIMTVYPSGYARTHGEVIEKLSA